MGVKASNLSADICHQHVFFAVFWNCMVYLSLTSFIFSSKIFNFKRMFNADCGKLDRFSCFIVISNKLIFANFAKNTYGSKDFPGNT